MKKDTFIVFFIFLILFFLVSTKFQNIAISPAERCWEAKEGRIAKEKKP